MPYEKPLPVLGFSSRPSSSEPAKMATSIMPWEKPQLTPGSCSYPSDPSSPQVKATAASTPQEKKWPVLTLPPKPLDTCTLHRDAHVQGHALKIGTGNCFAYFIETNREIQTKWEDRRICSKWKNKIKPQAGRDPNEMETNHLPDK